MRKIVLLFIVSMVSLCGYSQSKIVVQISNLRNNNGVCRVCLFNSEATFSGKGGTPVLCVEVPAKEGATEALFKNVVPGAYAIAVFHDANNNKQMDKNFLGIPREGYGASRNKLPFAGAPEYKDNKFTVTDKTITTLRIRLRNL